MNLKYNMRCKSCGHEWYYAGHLKLATCPSCNLKNKTKQGRKAE